MAFRGRYLWGILIGVAYYNSQLMIGTTLPHQTGKVSCGELSDPLKGWGIGQGFVLTFRCCFLAL